MAILLLPGLAVHTNENPLNVLNTENKLFIITIDGLRWQEVFHGADARLVCDAAYNADTATTKALYWRKQEEERRQKLMPFFWSVIGRQGELYGNREKDSRMNVANPYALSYPGYNELLTGRVDLSIYGNGKAVNPNHSILDFLSTTAMYKGKVAAFTSWDAFPFILRKAQSSIYLNSGSETAKHEHLHSAGSLLNTLQHGMEENKTVRPDERTFNACIEYIQTNKPSIVFLSFSGTDEAAHDKHYDQYLQQASNADRMIGELWQYLQTLPDYAGKTSFLITTDHGRGSDQDNWYTHGIFVSGSSQTWMCLLGKGVPATGEQQHTKQLYQKNLRSLMLRLLSAN
jgi:hypothetical protein